MRILTFAASVALLACSAVSSMAVASPRGGACPATVADARTTPPPSISDRSTLGGMPRETWHGNDTLWVALPPDGVVPGSGMKIPAYRLRTGSVEAEARRLDGDGPVVRETFGRGYGDIGFVATGMTFPVAGCWDVTYRHGGSDLRFVLDVRLPERDAGLAFADAEAELLIALARAGVPIREVRRGSKLEGFLGAKASRDLITERGWIMVALFEKPSALRVCESDEGEYVYRFERAGSHAQLGATAPLHIFATDRLLLVSGEEQLRLAMWEAAGKPDQVTCQSPGASAFTSTVIA